MTACVALLRGVNVGKAKRISSAELQAVAQAAGMTSVRTILNSGNAVGECALAPPALAAAVSAELEHQRGFTCDVVVRTRADLERALAHDPLGAVADDPSRHLLIALATKPSAAARAAFAALDLASEQWILDGADLHTWLPAGVAESALLKALTKGVLGVAWTGRNWATVGKLVAAMG